MATIVTLLTDFGGQDPYVGEVKARLLGIPDVRWVDLTHQIAPQAIQQGAFQLWRSYRYFPKGTYHLAIVDPGVGSARRAIYVRTADYHFVGPDNGLLKWAVADAERATGSPAEIFEIGVPAGTAPTFHGRDVFAPFIVAHARGQAPELRKLSPPLTGTDFPVCQERKGYLEGNFLVADHFGNLVTNVPVTSPVAYAEHPETRERLFPYPNYARIPPGDLGLLPGSHGFWEIAVRDGSAQTKLPTFMGRSIRLFLNSL